MPTYELCSREEILEQKLGIWKSRLAFALAQSDARREDECDEAIRDLTKKLAAERAA